MEVGMPQERRRGMVAIKATKQDRIFRTGYSLQVSIQHIPKKLNPAPRG
jgi:hypothetical protein